MSSYSPGQYLPKLYCPVCGSGNLETSKFCAKCGKPLTDSQLLANGPMFNPPPQQQPMMQQPVRPPQPMPQYPFAPPMQAPQPPPMINIYQVNPPFAQQRQPWSGCPRCGSAAWFYQSRISQGGWVCFAILLVLFFPLCWIGFLMKDRYPVCSNCRLPLSR